MQPFQQSLLEVRASHTLPAPLRKLQTRQSYGTTTLTFEGLKRVINGSVRNYRTFGLDERERDRPDGMNGASTASAICGSDLSRHEPGRSPGGYFQRRQGSRAAFAHGHMGKGEATAPRNGKRS